MSCYQLQVKVISVVEIVVSSLLLIFLGFFTVIVYIKRETLLSIVERDDEYRRLKKIMLSSPLEQISMFMLPFVYLIVELGLAIFLFRSCDRLHYKRLRMWSTVTITLVVVGIFFFVTEILKNQEQDFADIIVMFVLNLVFTVYSIWAVHCLMQEIKSRGVHHPVPYQHQQHNYNSYNYDTENANAFYKL